MTPRGGDKVALRNIHTNSYLQAWPSPEAPLKLSPLHTPPPHWAMSPASKGYCFLRALGGKELTSQQCIGGADSRSARLVDGVKGDMQMWRLEDASVGVCYIN